MEYDHREAMKLANQMCFPLYAASRNVISLYTPYLKPLAVTDNIDMKDLVRAVKNVLD